MSWSRNNENGYETSSTLFLSQLPEGLTETQLIDIFKKTDGFKTARIRRAKTSKLVGFAEFDTHDHAVKVKADFDGKNFPNSEIKFEIELSHTQKQPKEREPRREFHNSNSNSSSNNRESDSRRYFHSELSPTRARDSRRTDPYPVRRSSGYAGIDSTSASSSSSNPNSTLLPPPPPTSMVGMMGSMMGQQMGGILPSDASSTLFVEGIPADVSQREIAHIFRPFMGFQIVRFVPHKAKMYDGRAFNLCFIEFENKAFATIALNALQGYRLDAFDANSALKLSFSKSSRSEFRKQKQASRSHSRSRSSSRSRSPSRSNSRSPSPMATRHAHHSHERI